jgi:sugar phosphate isomerase/epimerase
MTTNESASGTAATVLSTELSTDVSGLFSSAWLVSVFESRSAAVDFRFLAAAVCFAFSPSLDWLKQPELKKAVATIVVTAAAIVDRRHASIASPVSPEPLMADFLACLNASTIKPAPILDQIGIAAQAGYTAIELWHADIDKHLAAGGTLSGIKQAVEEAGLTVPTTIYLAGWFESTGEAHAVAMAECRRRLEQAAAVGAEFAIAGPPAGFADLLQGAANYRELLELGLQHGVKPAMEFLGFVDDINTIEDALEIVTLAGHPRGTVVCDPFHIFRGGGDPASLAKLRGDQIAIFHFNDVPAEPPRLLQHDHTRVYPGDGVLDLAAQLRMLKQIGYNRWLSLELFREDIWSGDLLAAAKVGLAKTKAVVEAAGFTLETR